MTLGRVLGRIVAALGALVLWAFSGEVAPAGGVAMFAAAVALLLVALRPRHGVALLVAGFMALGLDPDRLEVANVWNLAFVGVSSVGAFLAGRRWPPVLRWVAVSLPFFAMSNAVPAFMAVALALLIGGAAVSTVRPLLSGRRRTGLVPLPHLADGPLTDVPPTVCEFLRGRGFLKGAIALGSVGMLAGGIVAVTGSVETGLVLAIVSAIVLGTFAFCLWFTVRMRFRADTEGIHARGLLGETTIRWTEVAALGMSRVYFLAHTVRYRYFRVLSPDGVIAFPETMEGSDEMCALVERATGLTFE